MLSLAGWLRRETERAAGADPAQWPRLLSAAEEWYLWREATAAAASGFELLDAVRLSEFAAPRGRPRRRLRALRSGSVPGDARGDAARPRAAARSPQRCQGARCDHGGAADRTRLVERPERAGHAPWLRGFEALPPRLRVLAAACAHAAARARRLRAAPGQRAARSWRRSPLVPGARAAPAGCAPAGDAAGSRRGARAPGRAHPRGARPGLAAWILSAARARSRASRAARRSRSPADRPRAVQPAHPRRRGSSSSRSWPHGCARRTGTAPGRACTRGAGVAAGSERPVASLDLRELIGALQLAPPRLKPPQRAISSARLSQAQAALSGGGGQRRATGPSAARRPWARWVSPPARRPTATAQQTLLRWHELLEEFGDLGACVPRLARRPRVSRCCASSPAAAPSVRRMRTWW